MNENKMGENSEKDVPVLETLEPEEKEEQKIDKSTITFIFGFLLVLAVFVFLLPNINNIIDDIKYGNKAPAESEEKENNNTNSNDNTNENLVELEDVSLEDLKAKVGGDVICVKEENTGTFAVDKAIGYYFVSDELVKYHDYVNLRYGDSSSYNVAVSLIGDKETVFNSYDGITGETKIGESNILNDYVYDLTIFDYETEIDLGNETIFKLDIESFNKDEIVAANTELGMSCYGDIGGE